MNSHVRVSNKMKQTLKQLQALKLLIKGEKVAFCDLLDKYALPLLKQEQKRLRKEETKDAASQNITSLVTKPLEVTQ